jgi:hypothetical protein
VIEVGARKNCGNILEIEARFAPGPGGMMPKRSVFTVNWSHSILKALSLAVVLAAFSLFCPAQKPAPSPPCKVYVGMYINSIEAVSFKDNNFRADFYIWFRWKDGDLAPFESFELANGRIESRVKDDSKDALGFHYVVGRVVATVTKHWELTRFPKDSHALPIEIEDQTMEQDRLLYIPDTENCAVSESLVIPGFTIAGSNFRCMPCTYHTNYGDPSLPTGNVSIYSRFVATVLIQRPDMSLYFKLSWAVLIALMIALGSLWIRPDEADPRFGLPVGALFAAVASEYVVTASLPDSGALTSIDLIHMTTVLAILMVVLVSIVSLHLWTMGRERTSRMLYTAS